MVKSTNKITYTASLSGASSTKEDTTQSGSKPDSKSSPLCITGEPEQLGVVAGNTTKLGIMEGRPVEEKMVKGTEKTNKLTGGLVSDDKGTAIGETALQDCTILFSNGKLISTTVAAVAGCQAPVKEIYGSDPTKFTIATIISFD